MKNLPRLRFAHLPTPIEEMPRLSSHLGGPALYIKRDDQTGLALGGNKTRKLEFLTAEAIAMGCKTLISAGALQSNHCRQTAAAAAKLGLGCILVLDGNTAGNPGGNYLLDTLFGAEIIIIPDRSKRAAALQAAFDAAAVAGKKPYMVPYGGSSPTGALAYAFAVEECMAQGFTRDTIVFASSSGGTQAGFTLGKRLFGYQGTITGISIDETAPDLQRHAAELASKAAALLGENLVCVPEAVSVDDSYCKAGYGVLTAAEREAVLLFARMEGIVLDPVYTGRAAAGLIDMIRKGRFARDARVLFWNTGGQPALFAEAYRM